MPIEGSEWELKSPQTLLKIKRQAGYIKEQRRLRTNTSCSPTDRAFGQLLKGFEKVVYEKAILEVEVTLVSTAANRRVLEPRNLQIELRYDDTTERKRE